MFVISTRNFPPDVGGIQNLMEGLSKALLNHGPVKVFADEFTNSEQYDKNSELTIQRVGGFKIFKKYRKANLISDFLKNNDARAIFFDHWKSIENINDLSLKKIPSFCLIHSKEINHPIGSSLNKRMVKSLNKSTYVIANSKFTKNLAIKLGIKKDSIRVINPGCNYPVKIEENYKKKAKDIFGSSFPKIITIARLDKRKSHQNILMCIRNLKEKFPNIKYISIGDGEEKKNIHNLSNNLDLNENVMFYYNAEEQLKLALLNESNLFLMPSIIHKKSIEGFGITFIEAASYNVASIGGKDGGEEDAIKHGETGYLCDGNNLNSIYETILKFLNNDNYIKLGQNAYEFSKSFNWNNQIKKYLNLI